MREVPKISQHYKYPGGEDDDGRHPISIYAMGNRYPWSFPFGAKAVEVLDSCHRLFHQVGGN